MLKLKLQYFGHLMRRVDSLEKTLMLGGIGGRRKRGRQRMRWLDGITDSMDVSVNSESWWWTGRPGVLRSWGRKESDTTEWLIWSDLNNANRSSLIQHINFWALVFLKFVNLISFSFLVVLFGCTSQHVGIPQPESKPVPPVVEAQSPNHWTTRGATINICFKQVNTTLKADTTTDNTSKIRHKTNIATVRFWPLIIWK